MPLTPKGKKIMHAMEHEYGAKKGKRVFYASSQAGKITDVHHSPDRYDDESTREIPARREYHTAQEQGTDDIPSARGTPSIVKADGTENFRAETKTIQAAGLSTPGGTKKTGANVQSYKDAEV